MGYDSGKRRGIGSHRERDHRPTTRRYRKFEKTSGGVAMKKESVTAIITGLKQAGINFVSMLPDSDFTDAQKTVMADKTFTCVPVSNEAIGFGVCAGAWLGGKKPALLI